MPRAAVGGSPGKEHRWEHRGEPCPATNCVEGTTTAPKPKRTTSTTSPPPTPAFIALAAPITNTSNAGLDVNIDSAQEVFVRMAMRCSRRGLSTSKLRRMMLLNLGVNLLKKCQRYHVIPCWSILHILTIELDEILNF
ncbi:hypothetical protein BDA96_04G282500 [Sorghum bicolor]|uniref:Uncharacterized protein n=2 Tax=Sorghum bicolor TaxID=4558 RepID=A0A921R7A0_SORBI|nr:hypothetical protein BDA96_04G282500 [Sorghum bicolor]KAG0534466.1 hypothetical protein BDA96_04G282500 [Sorghum bicolor]KAG0534468.1 hypothetical protein BDA96_04G282500 [Sorghum bicolor]KXG30905.1 hypothetical protein SORBI_3004G265300 [Sorghum bicolor]KXG30906.1 hypothetical protein SORBI_3004G265300 [Sorghum bicolor]